MAWYNRNESGKMRLVLECQAMKETGSRFVLKKRGEQLYWMGRLSPIHLTFNLEIRYPDSFPENGPLVYVTSPALPQGTPHLLSDQQMCIFHPGYARKKGVYDAARTTAATILGHAISWLICFEIWQTTGRWEMGESPTED